MEKNNHFAKSKEILTKEIDAIDKMEELNPINQVDSNRKLFLKFDLSRILLKKTQLWAQRAKNSWLKKGDKNIDYFHRVCSTRQMEKIYL